MTRENSVAMCHLPEPPTEAKLREYFRRILDASLSTQASALKIEPERRSVVLLRCAASGEWSEITRLPKRWQHPLTAWLKLMTGMNPAIKDRVQSGEGLFSGGENECRLSVSTAPTSFGERILIQLAVH